MSPENLPAVMVARPDACGLANNNVLDFGRTGLAETLDALAGAGLPAAGAGRDIAEAWQPAAVPVPGGSRAVVFACGAASSGIPPGLAATATRPGVAFLPRLSGAAADDLIADYERWSARCPSERPRARSSKSERAIPGTGRCERRSEILVRALALMTGVYRITMLPQRA